MPENKISILLPTANRPSLLKSAIISISEQTIAGSIYEIIISENGLNRESEAVCREFPNLPIKYFYQEEQLPPVQHIKKVFNIAGGDILAFLGDDDWWLPEHLETAVRSLSRHRDASAAFSRAVYVINEEAKYNLTMPNPAFSIVPLSGFNNNEFVYKYPEILSCCWLFTPFHFSTIVGRREALTASVNAIYDEVDFYNSDRELYPLVAEKGDIVFNDVPDTYVRWYDGNATKKTNSEKLDDIFNTGSSRILQHSNVEIKEIVEVWKEYLSGISNISVLNDVNNKLQRISVNQSPSVIDQPNDKVPSGETVLAIFTPFLGALSETFIQKHIDLLAPGKTVIVTGNIQRNPGNLSVLQLPWTEGPFKYSPQVESIVLQFLYEHNVTHILVEYGCQGTEIVELNLRKLHLPLYVHFHGYDGSQMLRNQEIVEYYKWMSCNVTGVIACSEAMAKRLIEAGMKEDAVIVNHYGIDVPSETSVYSDYKICRFVFVGRLVEKKAPLHLLKAFYIALKTTKNITLDIIGDEGLYGQKSKLFPLMKDFILQNNLENLVTLHGAQNQEYVSRILKQSSVYVQHSITVPETGDQEGLPNSILEAAAYGLPVISTKHSGIPEEVDDNVTGLLVEENDIKGMAEKMVYLAENPSVRKAMGEAARKKIIAGFKTEYSIENLRGIIFNDKASYRELREEIKDVTISVIIPAFNRAAMLEQAVKSLQAQTIPVTEIIIVDDASTDNTGSIVNYLKNKDSRIKYIKLGNNSGAQVARSTGIKNASSEWVAFLDSDDVWLPGRVEHALKAAAAGMAEVVYSNYIRRDPDGTEVIVNPPERNNSVYNELLKGSFVTFPGLFVKRKCFVDTGFLDESIKSWQEWDTALRLSKQYRFVYDKNPGFIWIWHGGDTISKDNTRELVGYLQIVLKYKDDIISRCGINCMFYHLKNVLKKISVLKESEELNYLKNQVTTFKQKLEESFGELAG